MLMHAKEFCGLVSDKTGPAATGLLTTCGSVVAAARSLRYVALPLRIPCLKKERKKDLNCKAAVEAGGN